MASVATTVASGGLSAAITTVVVTEAKRLGFDIGPEEAAALGAIFGAALHYATRWLPKEISASAPAGLPAAPAEQPLAAPLPQN